MTKGGPPCLWIACLVLGCLAACGRTQVDAVPTSGHHEHHAPHHGALEVLGDEVAHVELVLDPGTGTLTAYVLDGEAENPVRIAADALQLVVTDLPEGKIDLALKPVANVLSGETMGDTSEFQGRSERLKGVTRFSGRLRTITARGTTFRNVEIGYPGGNEHEEKTDAGN